MTDFWSFLLQTLTASGAAALLLAVKALFRDKLSPRWQFGVWGVLAVVLLLPAGWGGRYALFNWPLWLETAKTALTGSYSLTRVLSPVPLPVGPFVLTDPFDLLYLLYVAGVLLFALGYLFSYLRLRLALRRGTPADPAQVERVAAEYGLKPCRAVEVPGLPSAFVCGVLRPVLALPAGVAVDDKVLLHELLHLKYRDAAWGLLLCFFRCVHWCNPLLWYCMDRAGNDAEALCDQRVLERLEGEDRRDYGRILLSMAGGKYARAPGTSSMANGTRNIRERVQSIARFKRYPAGMALVSVCTVVVLGLSCAVGSRPQAVPQAHIFQREQARAMAAARVGRCTTPAGALDAYGKAVLEESAAYRALCAPLADHAALAAGMEGGPDKYTYDYWGSGLPGTPDGQSGYYVYNLTPDGDGYRALMVFPLRWAFRPGEEDPIQSDFLFVAVQQVRTERQEGRWVALPLEPPSLVETHWMKTGFDLSWGGDELPAAVVYRGRAGDFTVELAYQTVYTVDNLVREQNAPFFGASSFFSTVPKPDAVFDSMQKRMHATCTFVGPPEARADITKVAFTTAPLNDDGSRPALSRPGAGDSSSSSSTGASSSSRAVGPDWDGTITAGGGHGGTPALGAALPIGYAADIYVNGELTESLTLFPVEGGAA